MSFSHKIFLTIHIGFILKNVVAKENDLIDKLLFKATNRFLLIHCLLGMYEKYGTRKMFGVNQQLRSLRKLVATQL